MRNKDEYDFNLLFLPGVIDQQTEHNDIISNAIEVCEDRGDVFLVYDNTLKTDTVSTAKSNTEARNSSFAATYYPHVQIQDASLGTFRYVPPSVVIAGVYHFNDTVGQRGLSCGLNRGGIDSAVQHTENYHRRIVTVIDSNQNPIVPVEDKVLRFWTKDNTEESKCFR